MTRLNTHALKDLTKAEVDQIRMQTGNTLSLTTSRRRMIGRDGRITERLVRRPVITNDRLLSVDTVIETESGSMTLMEFWKSKHEKLRCQATLRESTSWNGILNRHGDFAPFLFDNGTRIKYVLPPDEVQRHMPVAWIGRLESMPRDEILERWPEALRNLKPAGRRKVLDWVQEHTVVGKAELNAALKAAEAAWSRAQNTSANDDMMATIEAEGRKPIMYDASKLPEVLNKVERAVFGDSRNGLVLSHTQGLVTVQSRRPTTVREVEQENRADDDDAPLGLAINRYEKHGLALRIAASCAFLQKDKSGRLCEIAVPPRLVDTMLETSHQRADALVGIIEHPALKADGELVSGHGFDRQTGFYTRVPDALVPTLPDKITPQTAADSYNWIVTEALADFPFASELDRAGAVAMLLTAVQRRLMIGGEGAPMFAISAPVQSSGKTALARLTSYLVHGVGLAVTSWPGNDEEMGKQLLAILMKGDAMVLFDNLPEGGKIESDELARATTADKYRRRILGENREGEAPTNVVWCFTGNNIQPIGDFNTRTLQIYLDAGCEDPDRRSFKRDDLEKWCLKHRTEFFYHALVILVGYHRQRQSGSVAKHKPTRFKDWDRQVRLPIIWAGAPDPAELFEQNKNEDPQKTGRAALLLAWYDAYGAEPQQLKDVLKASSRYPMSDLHHALETAITDLLPSGRVTSKHLGAAFRRFENQWIGDFRIRKVPQSPNTNAAAKWFVESKDKGRKCKEPSKIPDNITPFVGRGPRPK